MDYPETKSVLSDGRAQEFDLDLGTYKFVDDAG